MLGWYFFALGTEQRSYYNFVLSAFLKSKKIARIYILNYYTGVGVFYWKIILFVNFSVMTS
jgi:hypothetical protein